MAVHVTGNTAAPKSMVILLHGYGANGQDLLDLGTEWQTALPDTVFISPDAPDPCEMSPVGYQWFSLSDWSPLSLSAGATRAAPWVNTFIDEQLARYNLSEDRLALVGFSQGTMMALYAGLRRPQQIAGVLGYSGALICTEDWNYTHIQKPPICLVHGINDNVVPVAAYYHAVQTLEGAGFTVDGHPLHGLMHGINQYGMEVGQEFLTRVLKT
jgi:phospholipase/carboxylesterase